VALTLGADGNRNRMTSLEGSLCGPAELCFCRLVVFGPARGCLRIAVVYRPFGHVAGTPWVLCRDVARRTSHDDLAMTDDRHVG
jgi:hypothetical protein